MDTSDIDNRKEAWGLILRSAQRHFSEGIEKSNTARNLYGTKYLPVIGANDPMRTQLLRKAHELEPGAGRVMHNLEKTTIANLVCGPVRVTWKTEKKDKKGYIKSCGVCLK